MLSARDFLIRGLLIGLLAGIAAFAVAYVAGEPSVDAAIAIEESGSATTDHDADHAADHDAGAAPADEGHSHGDEAEVPRSLQSTVGLLTATGVAGITLGGLVGVLSALALGRLGSLSLRGSTVFVAAAGFVAVYFVPFLAYPPNPPAVGSGDTIGYRTELYFVMVAISVIAMVTATLVGVRLRTRIGGWYAALAAGAGYVLVAGLAIGLMPHYDEVPDGFPPALLYDFRWSSLLVQATLWTVLGLGLAEVMSRRARTLAGPTPVQEREPVAV